MKIWPQPVAKEDRFFWKKITFSSSDTCLDIRAVLGGAYGNLSRVDLEWAPSEEDCPSCPFHARKSKSFALNDPAITRHGQVLNLHWCQLPETKGFRWRLVGYNIYPKLQTISSEVMFAGQGTNE